MNFKNKNEYEERKKRLKNVERLPIADRAPLNCTSWRRRFRGCRNPLCRRPRRPTSSKRRQTSPKRRPVASGRFRTLPTPLRPKWPKGSPLWVTWFQLINCSLFFYRVLGVLLAVIEIDSLFLSRAAWSSFIFPVASDGLTKRNLVFTVYEHGLTWCHFVLPSFT